ncbi:hypothetical protein BDP27DRAFT_1330996 [Rhodocollybia butyracea]|uniref:ABM domain-containing protein n=1 Tax=Rhodocollybia butyracea TaxID=206335 RepID=A0A9P5PMV8_9AGAR|nr:hypothetical protein BDP27DRAFT_1330996 [Rhodocollybia butyracea]
MSTGSKVIQCTYFDASDSFINNRNHFSEGLAMIAGVDGHISSYWGLQASEEGANKGYVISSWESVEHYKRFVGTDKYTDGLATLKSAAAGDLRRTQFAGVVGHPVPAMNAEVTEVVLVKPNAGVTGAQIKEAVYKLEAIFDNNGHPAALGESVDKEGLYIIFVGWPSVAESRSTVKSEPFASAIAEFTALASLEITHAVLDKHT